MDGPCTIKKPSVDTCHETLYISQKYHYQNEYRYYGRLRHHYQYNMRTSITRCICHTYKDIKKHA